MNIIFFLATFFSFQLAKASDNERGWIQLDENSQFKIFNIKLSFWKANNFCQKHFKNSNLITIFSEYTHEILSKELAAKNITEAWIGLTDFGHEGRFFWISNYKVDIINNWQKSFPGDFRKSADCVLTKLNGTGKYTWVDAHCSANHSFVCMSMSTSNTQKTKLLPHQSHYTNQCPKPFFPIDGDCFWISTENLTWDKGRSKCQEMHEESDLASIRTVFQQEYFSALISGNSTAFWIGLNFYENQFQWTLQHDVTITKWGENEPNSEKKPCVYMSGNEHQLGEWYSASCTKQFQIICQTLVKQNSSQTNSTTALETDVNYDGILFKKMGCAKEGYVYYHGSCYRLLSDRLVSHENASKMCEDETFFNTSKHKFQVELVHFDNSGEKYFILSNLRQSISEQASSSLWLGINGSKSENESMLSIKFSKNSQVFGFEYAPNSMNSLTNMCFKLMLDGVVHVSGCNDKVTALVMCKYRLENLNAKDLDSNKLIAKCPEGWELFNSVCFYFNNKKLYTQYNAKKKCMQLSSHLPSIDMQQQIFLKDFINNKLERLHNDTNFKAWIGLEIFRRSNNTIHYKWANESPMRYINLKMSSFIHEHPGKDKRCAVFSADNGLWEVVKCVDTQAKLICQKPANIRKVEDEDEQPIITTTIPSVTTKRNPSIISEQGYKFRYEKVSWNKAFQICQSLPVSPDLVSNLVVFKQYSEILKLKLELEHYREKEFWIGLNGTYDHFDNAFLRWSDNSWMVFQNFEYDNLINLLGSENCVVMDFDTRKWLAVNCNESRPFICQITAQNNNESNTIRPSNFYERSGRVTSSTCPDKYSEYSNKCYHVIDDQMLDWQAAEKYCNDNIPQDFQSTAYLANIDSTYDNSFVYSLLSSNIYSNKDTRYWIGVQYKNSFDNRKLCTAISGHPDPYVGARWFTLDCLTPLKFICSTMKSSDQLTQTNTKCADKFIEYKNAMGTSCYHLNTHKLPLVEGKNRCNMEIPKSHLLSLQSHYHMHFIRSQMPSFGFSRDRGLWLGAEIEAHQQFYNWEWFNGREVRYTIWNKQPILDRDLISSSNLCLQFFPESYSNKLGMQVEMCNEVRDHKLYAFCEYIEDHDHNSANNMGDINCLRDISGNSYEGQANYSVNRHRCMRWDLIKPSPTLSKIVRSVRNDINKRRFLQYQSNECRFFKDMGLQTTFCAIETDHSFVECMVSLCRNISKTLHHEVEDSESHSNTLVAVFVTLVLFLCIIVCIAMLSWRRWNKGALFGGYLRRSQFSFLNNQSRGTSFNNPIYRPINT